MAKAKRFAEDPHTITLITGQTGDVAAYQCSCNWGSQFDAQEVTYARIVGHLIGVGKIKEERQ